MFQFAAIVLVLAAVGIQGRPQEGIVFDCSGRSDGMHQDERYHQILYKCMDGVLANVFSCPEGQVFDGVDKCIPANEEKIEVEETSQAEVEEKSEVEEKERPTIPQVFTENDEDNYYDDGNDVQGGRGKKLIYNIEVTKNIFPKSVLIIGKMNREQKNK